MSFILNYLQNNPFTRQANLNRSIAYRQTDPRGRRRMERAVSMGLPANVIPEQMIPIGSRGITPYGANIPMTYALPPAGFGGGWGSIGMDREPRSTGKLQAGAPLGSSGSSGYDLARSMRGGPQPAESTLMSSGGSPLEFTGFGGMMREQEEEMNRGLGSLTGFGGIPRFPFANY